MVISCPAAAVQLRSSGSLWICNIVLRGSSKITTSSPVPDRVIFRGYPFRKRLSWNNYHRDPSNHEHIPLVMISVRVITDVDRSKGPKSELTSGHPSCPISLSAGLLWELRSSPSAMWRIHSSEKNSSLTIFRLSEIRICPVFDPERIVRKVNCCARRSHGGLNEWSVSSICRPSQIIEFSYYFSLFQIHKKSLC